jgi:hypothetical protein
LNKHISTVAGAEGFTVRETIFFDMSLLEIIQGSEKIQSTKMKQRWPLALMPVPCLAYVSTLKMELVGYLSTEYMA